MIKFQKQPQSFDLVLSDRAKQPKATDVVLGGQSQEDFWGIMHLPDVLADKNTILATSKEQITTAIQHWKAQGQQVEICCMGKGRVGTGYGYYSLVGSRNSSGYIDSEVYVITACDEDAAASFAEKHQIVNYLTSSQN